MDEHGRGRQRRGDIGGRGRSFSYEQHAKILQSADQLLPQRAKFFLNANHLLIAQKRLSPNNTAAIEALKTPAFTASISVQEFDNEGMPSQLSTYTLTLGKSSKSGSSAFYYAKASNIDGYFILSLDTVSKLAALDLFEEE